MGVSGAFHLYAHNYCVHVTILIYFPFFVYSIFNIRGWVIIVSMLRCLIISFLLLCLLYHEHQSVSNTEILCACYDVWLLLFTLSVHSIIKHQTVSITELMCACYGILLHLFYFSVYYIINISRWVIFVCMLQCLIILFSFSVCSIINISRWVILNYCVHVTMFHYSLLLLYLSTSVGE